jgi:hypothetical protein
MAVLGALAASARAHATVAWTSTFETGDMSEWSGGTNPTKVLANGTVRKNVEVLGEEVYTGKYACKITVHPDDLFGQYVQDRVDIQHPSTLTAEGADTWISGHYFMPADAGVRNEFAFWESHVSFTNVMDFWVEPKGGGGTTVNFGVGFLGATKIWTADFAVGKWHQVAMHVHWSTNPQIGTVDIWFDGQQVVTAYKAKTKADGNTLFFQTGLHRRNPQNFVDTIYIDDFVEADSFADAAIGLPITPGSDGGASIASTDGGTDGADSDVTAADAGVGGAGDSTVGADAAPVGTMAGLGESEASGMWAGAGDGSTNGGNEDATSGGAAGYDTSAGSSGGCAITRARSIPLASLLALIGIVVAGTRRRAQPLRSAVTGDRRRSN